MNAKWYNVIVCYGRGTAPIVSNRILAFVPEHVISSWLEDKDAKTQKKWRDEWNIDNLREYPGHRYNIWYIDEKWGPGQILIIKANQ